MLSLIYPELNNEIILASARQAQNCSMDYTMGLQNSSKTKK